MNRIKNLISKNLYNRGILQLLILLVILFLYLYFPNNNSSWDGYVYAAQVKYNVDMFQPHHLLYNPLLKVFYEFISIFNDRIDILLAGKWMNAIFQGFNLLIAAQILRLLKVSQKDIFLLIAIIAFSFNPWRFGTENEAYIVPITFSMLGTWAFLKYLNVNNVKWLMLTSLFAAVACLFHQIHFFWWLGLGIGVLLNTRNIKHLVIYSIPAIVVPLVYVLVIRFELHQDITFTNTFKFVLQDYYSGAASAEFSWKGILFIFISSVRTFFQIHPVIIAVISKSFLFIIPLIISLLLIFNIVLKIFKKQAFYKKMNSHIKFRNALIIIMALQLAMAYYSHGNVEFMVMIPLLLILILSLTITFKTNFLINIALLLFIWNFFFGILPYHLYTFHDDKKLVDYIIENPEETYIVKNRNIEAKYFYATGRDNQPNILLQEHLNPLIVDSLLIQHNFLITDVIDYAEILNREKLMQTVNSTSLFKKEIKKEVLFTYDGLFGKTPVYKVVK